VIGSLVLGQLANVYEERLGWYRIGVGRWVSSVYMKKEDLPVELPPPPAVAPDVLYYPLNEGAHYITQGFGLNPQWYPTSRGHNGVDWGLTVGNPIYAMQDGIVIVSRDDTTGYGRHVRIQHHNGISIYGHLSRRDVAVGNHVQAREVIGLSGGATSDPYCGNSTGPHLHAEFRPSVFPPPAPGSYVYGAVDIMPLLASHDYDGTPDAVLFRAKCTAYVLNTRYGPSTSAYVNGKLTSGQIVNVYEIKDGWYRISDKNKTWCAGWYTERLADPVYTNYMPLVVK
jgi:murein DD-endopeptidase MepM/ murein hydrolase activator NlpD